MSFPSFFSSTNRSADLATTENTIFDLIVIGGGVTGAGICLDAASRGLRTLLLEKKDYASGTSSKSTKLIHGGLRYLKQLELGLVRETGLERAVVHRLAPHLVVPEKMLLPLIKGGNYGKWGTSLGLLTYDWLAGVTGNDRRQMLSREQVLALEPLLKPDDLTGGGYYAEYRTDDARLTIELLKKAITYGARAFNYLQVEDFLYEQERIAGVICTDHLTGNTRSFRAHQVVSASGPWVDGLRQKDQDLGKKHLFLSKGVHVVFPREKLPVRQSIYFDVADGRMIFAIPRGQVTYVGTTDTPFSGDPNRVLTTRSDVQYLLGAVRATFRHTQLRESDIISSWAGLRPLIYEAGKSSSAMSRKDELFVSERGLISIAGGKLTGYRKMAQRTVDLVQRRIHRKGYTPQPCQTGQIPLGSTNLLTKPALSHLQEQVEQRVKSRHLPACMADYLVHLYGPQSSFILDSMSDNDEPQRALAAAEIRFGLRYEQVTTLADFFVRRTGMLYFHNERIPVIREVVTQICQDTLQWSQAQREDNDRELDQLIRDATTFYTTEQLASRAHE